MPPPNHQTGSLPSAVASKKRTFMCTVGAYGLRGCSTSDTPIASQARPASSGRAAIADGGRLLRPVHVREIHAAALEHIAFFDQARDPAAFFAFPAVAQEGLAVHLPAATMRACRSRSQALTASWGRDTMLSSDDLLPKNCRSCEGRCAHARCRHIEFFNRSQGQAQLREPGRSASLPTSSSASGSTVKVSSHEGIRCKASRVV
jgi:hypothetical protein